MTETGSDTASADAAPETPSADSGSMARSVRERIEAVHGELGKLELGSALTNAIEHLDALDRRVTALAEEHQRIREANAALAEGVVLLRAENERVLQASAGLAQAVAGSDERLDDLRFALGDTGREIAGVVQQAIVVTSAPATPAPTPAPKAQSEQSKSEQSKSEQAKSENADAAKPDEEKKPVADAKPEKKSGEAKAEDPAANGSS